MSVKEIDLELPRPVRAVHQIECSSICSLRCPYCVHKDLGRDKIHMSRGVYERALVHVDYHVNKTLDQDELNLCGIGESTLHPDLVDYVRMAREVVGAGVFLNFTTNGLHLTQELAEKLVPYMSSLSGHRPGVYVSLHRPEKARQAVNIAKRLGLLAGVSNDPALATVDWAGQVDVEVTASPDRECFWIRSGRVIVLSDGSVSSCCFDSAHDGQIGTVWMEPGSLKTKPYKLCANCDQHIAVKGYTQYPAGKKLPTVGR